MAEGKLPKDLPPEVELLILDVHLRNVAKITYKLFADQDFRDHFYANPAAALAQRGYLSDSKTIKSLHVIDREVFNQMVQDWRNVLKRQQTQNAGGSAPVAAGMLNLLAAAYFSGALSMISNVVPTVLSHTTVAADRDV